MNTTNDQLINITLSVEQIDLLRGLVEPINKTEQWRGEWRKQFDPEGLRYGRIAADLAFILLQARLSVEDN